jgi:hypothetical protein
MVGDDDVQASGFAIFDLIDRADSTVYRDNQPDPFMGQLVEGVTVQAVTFVHAVGDIGFDIGSECCERLHKQRRRGHAVGIKVTINDDPFAILDGASDTGDGLIHPFHEERVGGLPIALQEAAGVGRRGEATIEKALS